MAIAVSIKRATPDRLFPLEVRCGESTMLLKADGSVIGDAQKWLTEVAKIDATTEPGMAALCVMVSAAARGK